ncbi:MAG: cob(I)yrinic acid a,c-diamide adenosyltransferase [bacterium]|nr:cob(I)yrinic acid a,c-diamide adenosyltransferase [bacterium]
MAVFFTGMGDGGVSHVGQEKLSKDSHFLEALGELDETNSIVGLVRAQVSDTEIQEKLKGVQESLFIIQANIAMGAFSQVIAPPFTQDKTQGLEKEIAAIAKLVSLEGKFIISGETPEGAWLDVARTVTRRAERRLVALSREHAVSLEILSYMNRLSSYFYALARLVAFKKEVEENHPSY